MDGFPQTWNDTATTTVGLFWMAFWAFGLGIGIAVFLAWLTGGVAVAPLLG